MLDQTTRSAILRLREEGHGTRSIARVLGISRGAVRDVLKEEVPHIERAERAEPFREEIVEFFGKCNGNLVRVHEKLLDAGASLSYQALTAFCRRFVMAVAEWCRSHRHRDVEEQRVALARRLAGHFNYFGVNGNMPALKHVARACGAVWHKWLSRRGQRPHLNWTKFADLLRAHPLPKPRIHVQLWQPAS
jgi:predicted transcriptional regulator